MIFNEVYFNRRDWLIEKYDALKLNPQQLLLMLTIDVANQKGLNITLDYLKDKTKFTLEQLNQMIEQLIALKYLEITPKRNKIVFNIQGVFQRETEYGNVEDDFLKVLQKEFGRLLSQNELIKLNELSQKYSKQQLEYALRQTILYKSFSIEYMERVIINDTK